MPGSCSLRYVEKSPCKSRALAAVLDLGRRDLIFARGGMGEMVNFINLAKSSLVLPAAVSSFWLVDPVQSYLGPASPSDRELLITTFEPHAANIDNEIVDDPHFAVDASRGFLEAQGVVGADEPVVANRIRIEKILEVLNRVAEASIQMEPERASQLESVVLDLAEQAMALSTQDVAIKASTLKDLEKIELTVQKLSNAVANSIEPEMQL